MMRNRLYELRVGYRMAYRNMRKQHRARLTPAPRI